VSPRQHLLLPPTPPCLLHPDARPCLELAPWAAQPQPEITGDSAKAKNMTGVELTPVHPGKKPKPWQGCLPASQGLPPKSTKYPAPAVKL